MMVAAILIDNMDINRVSAWVQQGGQARDPNMRRRLCLDPGLDGLAIARKDFLHKGIGARFPLHRYRGILADLICDRGFWSAVEDIDDKRNRGQLVFAERRAPQLSCPEIAKYVRPEMKVRVEADPHLAPVWFVGRNKASRVAAMIDREDMEAVRAAIAAVR